MSRRLIALSAGLLGLVLIAPPAQARAGTFRVSITGRGGQANGNSLSPSISFNGRFVAFASVANNLVKNPDTNGVEDVFGHDNGNGNTVRISVSSRNRQGNGPSSQASISGNGRYTAFASDANNLVKGDNNTVTDVFVRDVGPGTTKRVSVNSRGRQGNGPSAEPAISLDGRHVAFASNASNLVRGDNNGVTDIFVRDLATGKTTLVSQGSNGERTNGNSVFSSISFDGRYVAFESSATNFAGSDSSQNSNVFVRDRKQRKTFLITQSTGGGDSEGNAGPPDISASGRFVTFWSNGADLVANDTNGFYDVFVLDGRSGRITRVSVSSQGTQANGNSYGVAAPPSISGSGRFVAFYSEANNLVGNDTNNADDIFLRDRKSGTTRRLSVSSRGGQSNADSSSPDISTDGRYVSFASAASNLVPRDSNGRTDIFERGPL